MKHSHHHPVPSRQLQIYQALSGRMHFSQNEYRTYQNELKGFTGERIFAKMIKRDLAIPHLALHSLYYEDNGNHFQPDCILLIPNQLHLLEIKNFEGEFEYQNDYLYSHTYEKNYRDPVEQLKRGKLHLQYLLPRLNIPLQIFSYVIFVNQSFTLYHAKRDPYIILPTQLKSYFDQLNKVRAELPETYHTYRQKLLDQHKSDSPFHKIPVYSYEKLHKGMLCPVCRNLLQMQGYRFCCRACSYSEQFDSSVLRMVLEFHLLFPNIKIQTGIVNNWSGDVISRSTIKKILEHYLIRKNRGRGTYYVFPLKNKIH